jgi:hypothetical protein
MAHICTPECKDFCYSCGKHEPIPEKFYRLCGECFHVFVTEEELLEADAKASGKERREHGELIQSCPLCIHDF